jgi:Uma2 family endonuclease
MNLIERQPSFHVVRDEPPPPPPVDRETFQRWAERQEGRYEWVRGEIVMMTEVSRDHALIVTRLVIALSKVLDLDRYAIATSDFGVNTGASRRFPDVLVEPVGLDGKGRTSENPVFIAEVLSASSVTVDTREKPAEYATLASLRTYAVFSQDEPRVWVWERGESGFPGKLASVEGRDARLPIPALGASLSLAEIYRGIAPDAATDSLSG